MLEVARMIMTVVPCMQQMRTHTILHVLLPSKALPPPAAPTRFLMRLPVRPLAFSITVTEYIFVSSRGRSDNMDLRRLTTSGALLQGCAQSSAPCTALHVKVYFWKRLPVAARDVCCMFFPCSGTEYSHIQGIASLNHTSPLADTLVAELQYAIPGSMKTRVVDSITEEFHHGICLVYFMLDVLDSCS